MGKSTVLALAALGISIVLLAQDFSALNVALPTIERELDTDLGTVQWVINAYALVFAMLIVTGGRLADQFGRRRVFLVGTGVFASMSLLAGLAPDATWLIGARALMGIGGALMWPAILGMAYAVLPPQKAALAGGLVIGAAGVGQAIGPISGGALTEFVGWRWVQLVNVPVGLLAMLVIWRTIPAAAASAREPTDYRGIVVLSAGLVALLLALDQGGDWGWGNWRTLLLLGVAAAALAAFVPIERKAGSAALVPGAVMGIRPFAVACVLLGLVAPAFNAVLLFLPQVMEKLLGFTPLEAGIGMLPMLGSFALVSFAAAPLFDRLGARAVVTAGAACLAVGTFLLAGALGATGYAPLVGGMVITGVGLGLFFPSVTTAGVTAIDPSRTSLAGGVIYMFQLAGGAIGLGLTTTIVSSSSRAALETEMSALGGDLPPAQAEALGGLLAGTESAQQVLAGFAPETARRLLDAAGAAFAEGVRTGLCLDAALALVAVAIAALLVRGRPRQASAAKREGASAASA
jgi:EmrB/QacA subfamily drug resistance transporter